MKKRLVCIVFALAMLFSMCAVSFAEVVPNNNQLPPWVEEGETWHPANGIMLVEDYGNCPKGHTGPSGYTYQGYTTGVCSSNFDDFVRALSIISIFSKDPIVVAGSSLGAVIVDWLDDHENPNLHYFKYVYTSGSYTFYHIIYTLYQPSAGFNYSYITCETYYA